jgi:hypothetical protein
LRGGTAVALGVGLLASALLLYRASVLAGGVGSIVGQLLAGVPMSYLTDVYFLPARITGITTWIHCNTAVAPLATLGWMLSSRNGHAVTFFRGAFVIGSMNAVLLAFTQGERLTLYEFALAAALTFLCARIATSERVRETRRVVGVTALTVALAGGAWFATEYGRTFLPRYAETGGAPSAFGVAWDQAITYVVTNLNNGMYAVDHAHEFTFPFHTLNGVVTTFGLDSPDAPYFGVAISQSNRLLDDIYPGPQFTTFSLPGYAYMELGWGGAVLMYWFGALVGIVHARLRAGEVWAVLIYPLFVVGVVDSFRIMYWPLTRMLIAGGVIAIVVTRMSRHAPTREPSVRAVRDPQ